MITAIGAKSIHSIEAMGRFAVFTWQMCRWLIPGLFQWRMWRRAMPLFYEIGNRTLPVIMITGTFVGLVLANQSYSQLKAAGFEEHMGVLLSVTLMQELGPVLSAVMLAGRVGGALTAELGTMKVTEQISALSVMGADPVRQLVVPRFLACLLMTPLLTFFCDVCGQLAGWFIAVILKGIPDTPYWYNIAASLVKWDIFVGLVKSIVFGGSIGIVACYKGFTCRPGAEGVGRACTESFVAIFIIILMTDFFIGAAMMGIYRALYGFQSLI
ncbi:MAG: MlaE family ABC transporter permease [Planctomycetota bacterium]|jgi:phospholipid/cholesterol/gamma-HCH transport system permease protein